MIKSYAALLLAINATSLAPIFIRMADVPHADVATRLAFLSSNERPEPVVLIGGALVLPGIALSSRWRKQ